MNRSLLVFAGVLAFAGILLAENPMITENKTNYTTIKINILASAEKMPDAAYGFQETKYPSFGISPAWPSACPGVVVEKSVQFFRSPFARLPL